MEEKNRYIYTKIDGYYWIKDIETNENYCVDKKIVILLNQQDKEIKKLKKELSKYRSYKTTDERIRDLENLYLDYKKENQQLKQQSDLQHRLEVAEKALELSCDYLVSVEGDELFELCKDIYNRHGLFLAKMNYFKTQAEKEVKGEYLLK